MTEAAYMEFQIAAGLYADGIAGPYEIELYFPLMLPMLKKKRMKRLKKPNLLTKKLKPKKKLHFPTVIITTASTKSRLNFRTSVISTMMQQATTVI